MQGGLINPFLMESRTNILLEFPKVLQYLSREAVSIPGVEACLQIRPFTDPRELEKEQSILREALRALQEYSVYPTSFPALEAVLPLIAGRETVLDLEGLWALQGFLDAAHTLKTSMQEIDPQGFPGLTSAWEDISWPGKLWNALNRCLDQSGAIRDQSAPELQEVRGEIRGLRAQCSRKVNESLTQDNYSHYLQDEYLTISSDRYVLALKSNFKGKVQGIIHDYSQTGETCYFEPMFLVDLNNRFQELLQQQKEEEKKVRAYLTDLARRSVDDLQQVYALLIRMDVLWARARLAGRLNGRVLSSSHQAGLNLTNLRHPLLVLAGHHVVPVDVTLKPGQKALVISGGNAGGKTVCLKSLGLAAIMAQSALPVPVDEGSSIPFWDKIFVSMVSQQGVEESLSTFTAQIEHFSRFWPQLDSRTLVILDEFGVGTDPAQGAALAQAVLDELLEKGVWTATATHFPALKAYALSRDDVRACSVLFDPDTKKPLYKLAYDQVGASQALKVAREQGLPGEIIDRAQEYLLLEGEEQNRLFERLNQLAAQRELELADLEKEKARLTRNLVKERRDFVREKERLMQELKGQGQEILKQWQEQKVGRKKALKELSRVRREADALSGDEKRTDEEKVLKFEDIALQDTYFYPAWNRTGLVRDKDGRKNQVKIDFGGISLWVSPGELKISDKSPGQGKSSGYSASTKSARSFRLDIRGKYRDEALEELEKYLDQALLSGMKQVEVIHGKGTGALKKAVREYLDRSPAIKDYTPGEAETADDGVTTVELP